MSRTEGIGFFKAGVHFNQGIDDFNIGNYDKAIADFTDAIRLDPYDAVAYSNRGITYARKKDYARARADWEKVLQIKSDFAESQTPQL